jgi:hypothetical protein
MQVMVVPHSSNPLPNGRFGSQSSQLRHADETRSSCYHNDGFFQLAPRRTSYLNDAGCQWRLAPVPVTCSVWGTRVDDLPVASGGYWSQLLYRSPCAPFTCSQCKRHLEGLAPKRPTTRPNTRLSRTGMLQARRCPCACPDNENTVLLPRGGTY